MPDSRGKILVVDDEASDSSVARARRTVGLT